MMIRREVPEDYAAIYSVNALAFATPGEAKLVDILRTDVSPVISLVAEEEGKIVGHILFTPVTLSGHADLCLMGLGPMAVTPAHQRKGTGSALVKAGLEACKVIGAGAVAVLGHPGFYPRFGFVPSVRYNIRCQYEAPEEAFMVAELQPGYLEGKTGTIRYHPAFDAVT